MIILETDRLLIRQLSINDAPMMHKLMNTVGWLQFIGDRKINSLIDAQNYLMQEYIPLYDKQVFGPYALILKEDDTFIGTIGIYKREKLTIPDLGFAILPNYYRQGYVYEAAKALLKYVKKVLKFNEIAAITTFENKASIGLLKKLDFKEEGEYVDEITMEVLKCFKRVL